MNLKQSLALTVAIVLLIAFAFQGTRGIWEPDEGFYLNAARAMVLTGDWLVPQFNYRPFLDKPPMVYWGPALMMDLTGQINEWTARAAHALWFAGTALMVGLLGRAMWGPMAGIISSLVYAGCAVAVVGGFVVTADMPVTFWVTASYFFFWKSIEREEKRFDGYKLALGVCLGCGILSKGPVVFLFMAAMFCFLVQRRRAVGYLLKWDSLLGLGLMIGIGGSWYAALFEAIPGALSYTIDNQIIGRLFTTKYKRNPAFYSSLYVYLPLLVFGNFPWNLSWLGFIKPLWKRRGKWRALFRSDQDPRVILLFYWILVPFVVFSSASSKLPLYVLPIFSPLSLVTARCWMRLKPDWFVLPIPPRRMIWPLVWVLFVLVVKGGISYFPTNRDTRQIWNEIRHLMPQGRNEIVVVNGRRHGLSFYSGGNVEWVTTDDDPYPTFSLPEPIDSELHELRASCEYHTFLVRDKDYELIAGLMKKHGLTYREEKGPFDLRLLITEPAPENRQFVRLAAMGDTRAGSSEQTQLGMALYHLDADSPIHGIVLLGDNISYEGNPALFNENFEKPYSPLLHNGVRFFAVLGNHDVGGGHVGFQLNNQLLNMGGRRYYTRIFGDNLVQLFCIDTNTLENDAPQRKWLREELLESECAWKVVAMHHPIYGNSEKRGEPNANLRQTLEPILIEGGANIALGGHNHVYMRLKPQNGIYYFVAGSGGMLDEGTLLQDDPMLLKGEDQINVALVLEFYRNRCEFKAVDAMEREIDKGVLPRHPEEANEAAGDGIESASETH